MRNDSNEMQTKYQLCRKVDFSNNLLGADSKPITGIANLQNELKIRREDINCYAVASYFDGLDYPWYKCPDDQFWINGIDREEYLHKTISVFNTISEAQDEMNKYTGSLEIIKITVDQESKTIWLNPIIKEAQPLRINSNKSP